ncbi:uncharacterized protein [Ptychodera flava]|uniref:uncharacterized protein n=1 Tax=Ptychodera flava TaxID=63121 RepID=UPI00396A36D8
MYRCPVMAVRNLTRWCPRISMLTQTSSRSLGAVSIGQCGVQKLLRNVVYGQFIGIQQFGKRMSTGVRTFQKLTEAKANADIELNVTSEGDVLQVLWPDGQLSRFNSIWLRHNCHCSICKQEHSGQKLFENTQIDQNPTLSEVKIAGEHSDSNKTGFKGERSLSVVESSKYFFHFNVRSNFTLQRTLPSRGQLRFQS